MQRNDLSCLDSIDGLPSRVKRAVGEVCRRTNTQAKWNRLRNTVHFYLNSPWFGVTEERVDGEWTSATVDGVVRYIQSGQMARAQKDLELARAEREEAYRIEKENERLEAARDREAESRVEHDLKRASMGKHWKGRAVVSGLKG